MDLEAYINMCRSCLDNEGNNPIFGKKDKEAPVSEMLFACTSITVIQKEPLPQHLCDLCLYRLRDAFAFHKQCQKSEAKLRMLNNTKTEIEVKDEKKEFDVEVDWQNYDEDDDDEDEKPLVNFSAAKLENFSVAKLENLDIVIKKVSEPERKPSTDAAIQSVTIKKIKDYFDVTKPLTVALKPKKRKKEKRRHLEGETSIEIVNFDNPTPFSLWSRKGKYRVNVKKEEGAEDDATYSVRRRRNITERKANYAPVTKLQLICDKCSAVLSSKKALILHMKIHAEGRPHKCDVCQKGFKMKEHLYRHRIVHGENESVCDICGKGFKFKTSLTAHMTIHTGETPHSCRVCGQSFRTYKQMRAHRDNHGVRTKNHVCEICGKKVFSRSSLNCHRRTHTGERPEQCPLCPKAFSTKSILSTHIKSHLGQKDHQCPDCEKSFVTGGALKAHSNTHRSDKPFRCEVCDKLFSCPQSLRTHEATHSLANNFTCNICGESFKHPSTLYVHRKQAHNIQNQHKVQLVTNYSI